MFTNKGRDSQLRLIDFGSGTLDGFEQSNGENPAGTDDDIQRHHTFAGSAFYISPEMFQRTYTSKTDVWSAGSSLYVLVAGYPADRLQETFNILQTNKPERLKKLPNMPDNMPDSFYEMLEGGLVYQHKKRMDAGQLMKSEFAQFHIHHKEGTEPGTISIHDIAAEAAEETPKGGSSSRPGLSSRTKSVLLEGSVLRHNAYLGYQKFERSVTTVLATMLSKDTSLKLLLALRAKNKTVEDNKSADGSTSEKKEETSIEVDVKKGILDSNAEKLQVVTIKVLLEILAGMEVQDTREVIEV